MLDLVYEFFGIAGVDIYPPENMAELIPYLLQVGVAIGLVIAVFKMVFAIVRILCDWRIFK